MTKLFPYLLVSGASKTKFTIILPGATVTLRILDLSVIIVDDNLFSTNLRNSFFASESRITI